MFSIPFSAHLTKTLHSWLLGGSQTGRVSGGCDGGKGLEEISQGTLRGRSVEAWVGCEFLLRAVPYISSFHCYTAMHSWLCGGTVYLGSCVVAVLSVFSPLLHSNEGKVEASERQSKLRANLDLFSRNLRVSWWGGASIQGSWEARVGGGWG